MKSETDMMSIRYHLKAIGMILEYRLEHALSEYKGYIIACIIGVGIGFAISTPLWLHVAPSPSYNAPIDTTFVQTNTDKDTTDTEITNSSIGWNETIKPNTQVQISFNGSSLVKGKTVTGFECRLNDGEFQKCQSPRLYANDEGSYTFEVRAVDNNKVADNTPAVFIWSVK